MNFRPVKPINELPSFDDLLANMGYIPSHGSQAFTNEDSKICWIWGQAEARISNDGYYIERLDIPEFYNIMDTDQSRIYIDFSNINLSDNDSIINFVKEYGLLGIAGWNYKINVKSRKIEQRRMLLPEKGDIENNVLKPIDNSDYINKFHTDMGNMDCESEDAFLIMNQKIPAREPLEDFKREAQKYKNIIGLYNGINTDNKKNIIKNLTDLEPWSISLSLESSIAGKPISCLPSLIDIEQETSIDKLINIGERAIHCFINDALETVSMKIEPGQWRPYLTYYSLDAPSLLQALYFQLCFNMVNNQPIKKCPRLSCGEFFIPTRIDQKYCTVDCKNAEKQKRYRLNLKEHKNAKQNL